MVAEKHHDRCEPVMAVRMRRLEKMRLVAEEMSARLGMRVYIGAFGRRCCGGLRRSDESSWNGSVRGGFVGVLSTFRQTLMIALSAMRMTRGRGISGSRSPRMFATADTER